MLACADVSRPIDSHTAEHEWELVALAEQRLRAAPYAELRRISCGITGGELTLNGSVPRYYLKQRAYQTVADLAGGQHVRNEIVVTT